MSRPEDLHDLPPAWLASALEHVADRLALIDGDGALRYVSPALRQLAIDPASPADPLARLQTALSRALSDGREHSELEELAAAEGVARWEFRVVRLPGAGGARLALIRPAGASELDVSHEAAARRTRELAQANRELEALNDVALAVNQTLELSTVLGIALERALGAGEIETGWVRLLSEDGSEDLEIVAHRGLSRACVAAVSRVPLHDSFAGKAVLTGKPIVLYSLPLDSPVCRHLATYEGIRCLANIPLRSKRSVIGVLEIGSRRILQMSERLVHFLTAIGNQVGVAIENARLYEQVQRRAWLDPLTRLYNRQRFHELLDEELRRRPDDPPPVLMVDLNDFKQLNDTLGHAQGDEALRRVAQRLRERVTPLDIVGRYGGDEFVIALLDPKYATQPAALPTLMRDLQAPPESWCRDGQLRLSLSVGLATTGRTVEELLQGADQAMYVQKRRHHAQNDPPSLRS
jgi:diguanylate cyclase (GGDEF)-like protein